MGDPRLYVFVDESGNPSGGNYYTLAATWCVSTRQRADQVLESTVDKCLSTVGGGSELKGSKLSSEQLGRLHSNIVGYAYEDSTVAHDVSVWESPTPLRHTLYSTPPAVAKSLIDQSPGRSEFTETFQATALTAVLDPVFHPAMMNTEAAAQIDVVLDATTWDRAGTRVSTAIDSFDSMVSDLLSIQTRDSQAVPGVQIADITAYAWARNRRKGDCRRAAAAVSDRQLDSL